MQDFSLLDGGASARQFHFDVPRHARQKSSLIFVDPSAKDIATRIVAAEKADLIFLSGAQDGLEQIGKHLRGRGGLSLIHLLANFTAGRLALGDKVLVIRSLREYVATLARIGRTVRGGEIVIGAGGVQDGQGDNFRRAFESYAAAPVRLWDGGALRQS